MQSMETHLLRNLQFVMESQYCTENGKILGDLDVHIMHYNKRIFIHYIVDMDGALTLNGFGLHLR